MTAIRTTHFGNVPVHRWRKQNLTQGFAYAKDPTSGAEFLFVAQAATTPYGGDVEDALFHRHLLTGDRIEYLDTMTGHHFGHPQTFHVRISVHGNAWIWAGVEQYRNTKTVGSKLARFRYEPGKVIDSKVTGFRYINTGPGKSTTAISSPRWKVIVRHAKPFTEIYEEHDERNLMVDIVKPLRKFTRLRGLGIYQSAGGDAAGVKVIKGATTAKHTLYSYNWAGKLLSKLDVTNVKAPTGPNTSSEPEGVGKIRGRWFISKRYNSVTNRIYALFQQH